jgi:FtsH-binding integral membrane protein
VEKIYFILLLLGAVCFLFAVLAPKFREPSPWVVSVLVPLGLLFWIFVPLIQTAKHM